MGFLRLVTSFFHHFCLIILLWKITNVSCDETQDGSWVSLFQLPVQRSYTLNNEISIKKCLFSDFALVGIFFWLQPWNRNTLKENNLLFDCKTIRETMGWKAKEEICPVFDVTWKFILALYHVIRLSQVKMTAFLSQKPLSLFFLLFLKMRNQATKLSLFWEVPP